ncbi:DUF6230 family protein [Thermomonospora umbrina]|uniref:Cholesterol esterase n=1 Tax=Thermomonospora umbrina TaxID=111806 RepID=A0A3D9TBB5_9ACTN|nr:DUF6230 family protein [Thermomonospora umbrina]REF01042.1 hypothetical protein DFJ69_6640 [Thermomonospora umbrina]
MRDLSPTRAARRRVSAGVGRMRDWDRGMREQAGRRHGTRLGGTVTLAVPALLGMAALGAFIQQGALAVNFATGKNSYKIYTDNVNGRGMAGYLHAQNRGGTGQAGTASIAFESATLNGLCAIATETISIGGVGTTFSLMIKGGEPVDGTITNPAGKQISASNLYLDATSLTGQGKNLASLRLGQSADTLYAGSAPFTGGTAGNFGIQAGTLDVNDLDADTYGLDLQGSINLPDLKLTLVQGSKTKVDCP